MDQYLSQQANTVQNKPNIYLNNSNLDLNTSNIIKKHTSKPPQNLQNQSKSPQISMKYNNFSYKSNTNSKKNQLRQVNSYLQDFNIMQVHTEGDDQTTFSRADKPPKQRTHSGQNNYININSLVSQKSQQKNSQFNNIFQQRNSQKNLETLKIHDLDQDFEDESKENNPITSNIAYNSQNSTNFNSINININLQQEKQKQSQNNNTNSNNNNFSDISSNMLKNGKKVLNLQQNQQQQMGQSQSQKKKKIIVQKNNITSFNSFVKDTLKSTGISTRVNTQQSRLSQNQFSTNVLQQSQIQPNLRKNSKHTRSLSLQPYNNKSMYNSIQQKQENFKQMQDKSILETEKDTNEKPLNNNQKILGNFSSLQGNSYYKTPTKQPVNNFMNNNNYNSNNNNQPLQQQNSQKHINNFYLKMQKQSSKSREKCPPRDLLEFSGEKSVVKSGKFKILNPYRLHSSTNTNSAQQKKPQNFTSYKKQRSITQSNPNSSVKNLQHSEKNYKIHKNSSQFFQNKSKSNQNNNNDIQNKNQNNYPEFNQNIQQSKIQKKLVYDPQNYSNKKLHISDLISNKNTAINNIHTNNNNKNNNNKNHQYLSPFSSKNSKKVNTEPCDLENLNKREKRDIPQKFNSNDPNQGMMKCSNLIQQFDNVQQQQNSFSSFSQLFQNQNKISLKPESNNIFQNSQIQQNGGSQQRANIVSSHKKDKKEDLKLVFLNESSIMQQNQSNLLSKRSEEDSVLNSNLVQQINFEIENDKDKDLLKKQQQKNIMNEKFCINSNKLLLQQSVQNNNHRDIKFYNMKKKKAQQY